MQELQGLILVIEESKKDFSKKEREAITDRAEAILRDLNPSL